MRSLFAGLMSGTSVDAIDAVLLDLSTPDRPQAVAHTSRSWPGRLRRELLNVQQAGSAARLGDIARLDASVASQFGLVIEQLIQRSGCSARDIVAIGSHGQTVFHQPDGESGNSLQIGDPNRLAALTGIPVVGDFRRADIAAGGQGAPLASGFHRVLWQNAERDCAVVNLGGIANVTWLGRSAQISGFDTGPANALMDAWIECNQHRQFDTDGAWAGTGRCIDTLVQDLLADPFFALSPPKSTGKDYFNLPWLEARLQPAWRPEDVQRSLLELTCRSVAASIAGVAGDAALIILCGGGAKNALLRTRLGELLANHQLRDSGELGWPCDWIEAAAFAWLAYRRWHGLSGNVEEVTGASRPKTLGGLYLP